jgi:galactokinase
MTERARRFVAPGRVNLIGEHTDYNSGLALPAAIDRYTTCTIVPAAGDTLRIHSAAFDETVTISIREAFARSGTWRDYAAGIVGAVSEITQLPSGAEIQVESDLPIGGGLSSSASFELALAQALLSLSDVTLEPLRLAEVGMRAERAFVGIASGVMDQLTSAFGVAQSALLLDCETSATDPVALPNDLCMAIIDSQTKRELVSSEYNLRRSQCEAAVTCLRRAGWEIDSMRDVDVGELDDARGTLSPELFRRVRHVVTENARVRDTVAALAAGDHGAIGDAMRASHESLRNDYEVTTPALDSLAEIARSVPGVAGARMTGGGFGGCVVVLAERGAFGALQARVPTPVFLAEAVDGAREVRR